MIKKTLPNKTKVVIIFVTGILVMVIAMLACIQNKPDSVPGSKEVPGNILSPEDLKPNFEYPGNLHQQPTVIKTYDFFVKIPPRPPTYGMPRLIGITFDDGILYDIDTETGRATNPRETGVTNAIGLSYSTNGKLYTLKTDGRLYIIDPVNGTATAGSLTNRSFAEGDMAFDPVSRELYANGAWYDNRAHTLVTINPATGATNFISFADIYSDSSLAFDSDGHLFVFQRYNPWKQKFMKVNKSNGQVMEEREIDTPPLLGPIAGMTFAPGTENLYLVDGTSRHSSQPDLVRGIFSSLYTLNSNDNRLRLVGLTGIAPANVHGGFSGLAFEWHSRIEGYIWKDANRDKERDLEEQHFAGWRVYLDLNENLTWDSVEPFSLTDMNGHYVINHLEPGCYNVRQEIQGDWVQTYPDGGQAHIINLNAYQAVMNADFGNGFPPGSVRGEDIPVNKLIPDLDAWLNGHPTVANSIIWEDGAGSHVWTSWSESWKAQLRQAFGFAWLGKSITVAEIPPNQAVVDDNEYAETILAAADAWAYFKASVAQSLVMEISHQLPWSFLGYPESQLSQLFDSREMFYWIASSAGYRIDKMHGRLLPAPPLRSYHFLVANDLIGHTRLDTLSRVLEWCRENLSHSSCGNLPHSSMTAAETENHWQYRGYPPMTRVLDGTIKTSDPGSGIKHYTAGCWGTTGLLRALLRVINIPVKLVTNSYHAQPWFMADSLYLSHGDDPYNIWSKETPFPAGELLINQAKFDAWFGTAVNETDRSNRIGFRPKDLAIVYLPNRLLHRYCLDLLKGKNHAEGKVFELFSPVYTVAQLEAKNLWDRMDAKIAGFGGCERIPVD